MNQERGRHRNGEREAKSGSHAVGLAEKRGSEEGGLHRLNTDRICPTHWNTEKISYEYMEKLC